MRIEIICTGDEVLTGKAGEALPYLQAAVDIDPSSAEARQFLAEARKASRR